VRASPKHQATKQKMKTGEMALYVDGNEALHHGYSKSSKPKKKMDHSKFDLEEYLLKNIR
jgi:hypothetical protein